MLKAIEKKMMSQNGQAVKHLTVITKETSGKISTINQQIVRDFGLAGPFTLSTVSTRVHAVRWASARELFVVETNIKRVTKETIAAAVSQTNKCAYCEDVHGTSIASTGDTETAKSIVDGTWRSLKDERLKLIIEWSLNTRKPSATIIKNPPFSAREATEIIGTALEFHSTNRLVSIFLEASPLPKFLSNKLIKKTALKIASMTLFKSMVSKKVIAGDSLAFISEYPKTPTSDWMKPVPAFAQAALANTNLLAEIETGLPIQSVRILKDLLKDWQGADMPIGRAWVQAAIINLPESEKPIANLMLLASFAPYTITSKDIAAYRKVHLADKDLLEVCYWSIQMLTQRIETWLVAPFSESYPYKTN